MYFRMKNSEWRWGILFVTLIFCLAFSTFYTMGFVRYQKNIFETRIRSVNALFEKLVSLRKDAVKQGYFVWSEMVAALERNDETFLSFHYQELNEQFGVVGLSIRSGDREVFRSGISFFSERMFTRAAGVLVGIFSIPVIYDDGTESDYTARIMMNFDSVRQILDPLIEDLPSVIYGTSGIPVYNGDFFVQYPNIIDFILNQPMPIFIVNSLLFFLFVLANFLSWLAIKWIGIENKLNVFIATQEQRDSFFAGHTSRVFYFAEQFARKLDFSGKRIKLLHGACLAHDIGKLMIPSEILNKPGPLDEGEYALIKQHPVLSKELFHGIMPNTAIEAMIVCHHEWWNGKGYPYGLAGEAIPIEARIISISDVFDALTSERVYRQAYSKEEAIKIIEEGSGTQFDPELVKMIRDIRFPETEFKI